MHFYSAYNELPHHGQICLYDTWCHLPGRSDSMELWLQLMSTRRKNTQIQFNNNIADGL